MDIRPIKTETGYHSALRQIDRLWGAEPDTPEGDKLEVLVALVEAYEKKHHPIPLPDPIDAIEYYIESRGLTRHDMEPYIGTRARVSEILNRKRRLTLGMIRKLEEGLGIPAAVLIQDYPVRVSEETAAAHPISMVVTGEAADAVLRCATNRQAAPHTEKTVRDRNHNT